MTKVSKTPCAKFLLILITTVSISACHKTPVKNNPTPVTPPKGTWKKVNSLPGEKIQALEVFNNTLYAASALGVVYSSVDGITWSASNAIQPSNSITALAAFNNMLFAGTQTNGIFRSTDGGKSWSNNNPSFPQVSSFAVLLNTLYCSSGAYSGIVAYNETQNQWSAFNNGLPTNYNTDVEKIIPFNNTLLSIQGVNGNYYLYDKTTGYWNEKYFFNSYTPGLRIDDIIYDLGILYATYDYAILASQNGGVNWSYDTVGLKRAQIPIYFYPRSVYAGTDKVYTIYNSANAGAWLQQRDRAALPGSTWATNQEHLSFGYSYAVRELNGMLFLATDNGLYFKKIG
ncbi:MAG TPA: hypothetical protein VGN20_26050 [Mucilaginibacter sp.]|jgi:hypothetical protein